MADNRKYYYLKLKENYFDEDAIVLLESMQDGILYSNILLKLYLKSLKNGGKLPVSYTHLDVYKRQGLLSPRLTAGTRQAWQRRQGFYRYLSVAALPCSLIPTPPDDEQSPGIFHLQEDFE